MAMYVQEVGPVDGPTVVLLHGGGVGGWSWQPVVERLRTQYHCLVPDLPEQGKSLGEGPFNIDDAARRLADLIRSRAHGGRAHVAGLSLGSQVAVYLLAQSPDLVDHALLSGTLARSLPGVGLIRPMLITYMPFRNLPFMVRANMRSLGIPDQYYPQFAADTRLASLDSMTHLFAANMAFRLPPGLDRVVSAVLVLVGEHERGIMRQSARALVRALPGARGRIVSGANHNWPLTQPDLFTATLRAWLEDGCCLPTQLLPLEG